MIRHRPSIIIIVVIIVTIIISSCCGELTSFRQPPSSACGLCPKDVGTDDLIGQTKMSLIDLMNEVDHPDQQQERLLELFSRDNGRSHGHLFVKPQFLPAGKLRIRVLEGKKLREITSGGRMDPYLTFSVDGAAVQIKKKTKVLAAHRL